LLQGKLIYTLDQALAENADIFMMQRQYVPEIIMYIRKIKQKEIILGSNVDDDVWHLPTDNPAKSVYTPQVLARYEQVLKEVDFLTTSTPYLKKLALKFNQNVFVERNLVESHLNEFVSPGRDKNDENTLRIGWHLTPHHKPDADIIKDVVPKITKHYPQVKWIMMGWLPPSIATLPKNKYEYYNFVPVDAFYPALASLDMDIGIAPLQDNAFNWGKTNRKALEYAILGIPMILSPVLPYLGWDEKKCAVIPKSNASEDWISAISYLIENKEKREAMAKRAYYYVLEHHNINTYIAEHAAIFYEMYNKLKGTNLKVPGYEDKVWNFEEAERIQNLVVVNGINDI
jgi:glycosyltransferase involved in cell wall biosynthesis